MRKYPLQPGIDDRSRGIGRITEAAIDLGVTFEADAIKAAHFGRCSCFLQSGPQRPRLRCAIHTLHVQDQKRGRVGRGGMMGRRKRELSFFFAAKGLNIGVLHEITAFCDLARHIVTRTIERNDAAQRLGSQLRLF